MKKQALVCITLEKNASFFQKEPEIRNRIIEDRSNQQINFDHEMRGIVHTMIGHMKQMAWLMKMIMNKF